MYEKIINVLKEKLGENLLCAVKFGTEGEPNNFLCVLEKIDFAALEQLKETMQKQGEKIVPLFFTRNELQNAADVFPLEFLDIQNPHEVLYGQDLIATIKIEKKHVRRELESELRSKLIHLRENYIWIKKDKELKALLLTAVPSLMPLFYGLLYLKNTTPPTELDKLFDSVAEKYNFNVDILRKLKVLKDGKAKGNELKSDVEGLLEFLRQIIPVIDKMKV
ncbi:hypothetical protein CMO88_02035 [Candidatus Woesearchaeota archaeon]|nr:hypothetical protein [Candidatus Woesearchaeota archaeon]|tara:strand:- start:8630 stop:9292 length:663 start_codon:yes stop_codon:yes gene_type:complete